MESRLGSLVTSLQMLAPTQSKGLCLPDAEGWTNSKVLESCRLCSAVHHESVRASAAQSCMTSLPIQTSPKFSNLKVLSSRSASEYVSAGKKMIVRKFRQI